jgi:cytokinin dehydrogenase
MNRRGFLNGALAGAALVTAYIPSRGAWAAKPDPKDKAIKIPSLDGQLVLAGPLLQEAADDFGHIISSAPVAVLIPGSIHDVRKLIQFANKNGVKVGGMSMIGNTHSTYGQSQVAGGVVIDMSALCEIHQISATEAYVDAGVRWSELLEATLPLGKSPPVPHRLHRPQRRRHRLRRRHRRPSLPPRPPGRQHHRARDRHRRG